MNNKEMIDNLIAALKSFTENPDNLENFESYINRHSDIWFEKYASTPEVLISEMKMFANLEN